MLLSSSSSDMTGDLLERERQFSSVREMDGGAGGRGRRLVGLAVREVGVTRGREADQSEGIGGERDQSHGGCSGGGGGSQLWRLRWQQQEGGGGYC